MKIGAMHFDMGQRTYVMGILNVTPDSFSDGGKFTHVETAVEHALRMEAEGADLIDIGGESTRPGHVAVGLEEELARTIPVIEALKDRLRVPISIDTSKAEVARKALEAGADMVNDVWGLMKDPQMGKVVSEHGAAVCLMHNQDGTEYRDLMSDILEKLALSVQKALDAGVPTDRIILDPGIGFGKTVAQNLEVMRMLERMQEAGYPWLLGTSRKSLIGKTLLLPLEKRVEATVATNVFGIRAGADFIRVHDVEENVQAARMADLIVRGEERSPHRACIALGSNIGDRMEELKMALEKMAEIPGTQVLRVSSVYETDPVGYTEQDAFLNAAVLIETMQDAESLLSHLQAIETAQKRERNIKWGPRTIDLDILFFDSMRVTSEKLEIPHPRLADRRFVLQPLSDLVPLYVHPGMNRRVFELLDDLPAEEQRVEYYSDKLSSLMEEGR